MVETRSKSIRRRSVRGADPLPSSPTPEKKKAFIADLKSNVWHDTTTPEKLILALILATFCFIAITVLAASISRILKLLATQQPPMLAETTAADPEATDVGACLNTDDALDGDLALCPKPNGGYW